MKDDNDPLEKLFRERLNHHVETPPENVWDSLDTRIDQEFPLPKGSKGLWKNGWFQVSIGILSLSVIAYIAYTSLAVNKLENRTQLPSSVDTENEMIIPIPIKGDPQIEDKKAGSKTSSKWVKGRKEEGNKNSIQKEMLFDKKEEGQEEPEKAIIENQKQEVIPPLEPEPENLYEKLKKEQKEVKERSLFIEKKE